MVDFLYETCRKPYLVTIGAVSLCSTSYKLSLRKLSGQCLTHRTCRIRSTGNTHSLINVTSSRKRVTDRTSETRCGATKRFYLCRVIVCLILEADKPLLLYTVNLDRNNYRACIDLIGFFLVRKFALLFEFLHAHKRDVHQAYELILAVSVHVCPCLLVIFKRLPDRSGIESIIKGNFGKFRRECCMSAVITPIRIKNTYLRH